MVGYATVKISFQLEISQQENIFELQLVNRSLFTSSRCEGSGAHDHQRMRSKYRYIVAGCLAEQPALLVLLETLNGSVEIKTDTGSSYTRLGLQNNSNG